MYGAYGCAGLCLVDCHYKSVDDTRVRHLSRVARSTHPLTDGVNFIDSYVTQMIMKSLIGTFTFVLTLKPAMLSESAS
jgi:hypothetical protein